VRYIKAQRIKWLGHIQRTDQARPIRKLLDWKPMGIRPVGRSRHDLQEVGCGYVDWIGLVQDRDRWRRLVSALMNLRVP